MVVEFANPFTRSGRWLRGNLHVHSTGSDGRLSPVELACHYRSGGYDFLALSDHRVVTAPPDVRGILLLRAAEVNTSGEATPGKSCHLVLIEPTSLPEGPIEEPAELLRQSLACAPLTFVAHPYWSNLSGDDVLALSAGLGVEVYNTGCEVEIARGFSEYPWDYALSAGARLLGYAVDDAHRCTDDSCGGWVMVKVEEATAAAVVSSLRAGLFYSSMGPEIYQVSVDEAGVEVRCSPVVRIEFVANTNRGAQFRASAKQPVETARYAWRGGERYLRIQVTDAEGRRAWTNPVYVGEEDEAG